jgi:uncharacterized OsmC-like protein
MSTQEIQAAIKRVADFLEKHPEKARYTDTAATAVVDEGLRCRVEGSDGAYMISDMPKAIGGGGSAPSPGWLMRAALANCDATVIAMRAAQEGIALTTLEVTIDSESDDRGLLGLDEEIPAGPFHVRTRIRIGAKDVSAEQLHAIIEWAEIHSPVADAIRRAVPSSTEVEIV